MVAKTTPTWLALTAPDSYPKTAAAPLGLLSEQETASSGTAAVSSSHLASSTTQHCWQQRAKQASAQRRALAIAHRSLPVKQTRANTERGGFPSAIRNHCRHPPTVTASSNLLDPQHAQILASRFATSAFQWQQFAVSGASAADVLGAA